MSFLMVLGLIFVVLRLTGFIDWHWFWVISPFLLDLAITIFLLELKKRHPLLFIDIDDK